MCAFFLNIPETASCLYTKTDVCVSIKNNKSVIVMSRDHLQIFQQRNKHVRARSGCRPKLITLLRGEPEVLSCLVGHWKEVRSRINIK